MKNTGICRQPPALSAVLMAVAYSCGGVAPAVQRLRDFGAPQRRSSTLAARREKRAELYQSVSSSKNTHIARNHDYTQGYLKTSNNLSLVKTDCKSPARLFRKMDQAMVFDADGNFADAGFIAARIAGNFVCDNLTRRQRGRLQREDKDYPNLNE